MTKNEQKYINSLKEEKERVKNLLLRFVDALGKLKNLDDVVNMSLIPIMTEENKKFREEIKAAAYKECIEKVKEEIYRQPHSRSLEASGERARIIKIFDNLLKELVGE